MCILRLNVTFANGIQTIWASVSLFEFRNKNVRERRRKKKKKKKLQTIKYYIMLYYMKKRKKKRIWEGWGLVRGMTLK